MILRTEELRELPGLTSARLVQSATGESTLALEFACHVLTKREDAGAWLEYDEPVTVMHCGRPLFHGKVVAYGRSATPQGRRTRVTVADMWSFFEQVPLGAQVAELEASIESSKEAPDFEQWAKDHGYEDVLSDEGVAAPDWGAHWERWQVARAEYSREMGEVAEATLASWEELSASFNLAAPGWAVDAEGQPLADAEISMDCTRAHYSACGKWTRGGLMTPWQALQKMRGANPDCFFIARPDGVLEVVSLAEAEGLTLESGAPHKLMAVEDIAPRFSEAWAGVALLVSMEDGSVFTRTWPEGMSMEDARLKVFTARGGADALPVLLRQVQAWWEATNMLQFEGSVRVALSMLEVSPLGKKLCLKGKSMAPEWGSMEAIVGGVEWDFAAQQVTLTLGVSVEEPELLELGAPKESYEPAPEPPSSESSEEPSTEPPRWSSERRSSSSSEWGWDLPGGRSSDATTSSEPPQPPPVDPWGTQSSSSSSEPPPPVDPGGTQSSSSEPPQPPAGVIDVTELQKIWNAIVHLAQFGNGEDTTMPRYYLPEIFPEWWTPQMGMAELIQKVKEITGK